MNRLPLRLEPLELRNLLAAGLLREVWANIPGPGVAALTGSSRYPAQPDSGADLAGGAATAATTNTGERWRGLLTAPETGAYTFFVAGAGETQLRVSNDATARNLHAVAAVPQGGSTTPAEWAKYSGQRSAPVWLVAGQQYSVELLHQHGTTGTDNVAFGWQLPSGTVERPLPATRSTVPRPTVQLWATDNQATRAGNTASFAVTRDDDFGRDLAVPVTFSGTATNGTDYGTLPASVTIPAGQRSATVTLSPTAITAPARTATLTLAADDRLTLAGPSTRTATATIAASQSLPAGTSLIPTTWYTSAGTYGSGTYAAFTNVTVTGQPFTQAKQVRVTAVPPNAYQAQAQVKTNAAVVAGDTVYVSLWMRGDPTLSQSVVGVAVQQASGSYQTLAGQQVALTPAWSRVDLPFSASVGLNANDCQIAFNFGYALQTVQWGGLTVTDYGTAVTPGQLPTTESTYGGRDPNAAWRADAEARIDQSRRADLTVAVRDSLGRPVPGALVRAELLRNSFNFGSAVVASRLTSAGTADATYRQKVLELFNVTVLENDLKWGGWQSNPTRAINAVNWLLANGLPVRGHNLVWPSWRNTPSSTGASSGTYNGVSWAAGSGYASQAEYNAHVTADGLAAANAWLNTRILDHIASATGTVGEARTLAGKPYVWDVVNEPYDNHDFMDLLGQTSILDWYNAARVADPNAMLALNDYDALEDYGMNAGHRAGFKQWIQYLIDNRTLGGRDARLDVLGFQSHFGGTGLTSLDTVKSLLDGFTGYGKAFEVTEFTVGTADEQLQADYTRDYLTLIYSHPQMRSFLSWGFWEGQIYHANEAMYRTDWSIKPNGQVWLDLTQGQWDTDATATTWADGTALTHGTQGGYRVTVTYAGQTVTATATLGPGGTLAPVTLPFALPTLAGVRIDDGTAQRSEVRTLTATFSTAVTLRADAFTLTTAAGQVVAFTITTATVGGQTVATLTPATPFADGYYTLTLRADGARTATGAAVTAATTTAFHRLRGDFDGDTAVDGNDLAIFAPAFNSVSGEGNYRWWLDLDGDGAMDGNDLAIFAQRFNTVP